VFSFISIGNNTDCWYRNGDIPQSCFGMVKYDFPGTWKFEGLWTLKNKKQTIVGDFNGDGKQDFARVGSVMIQYFISKVQTFHYIHSVITCALNGVCSAG